MKTALKCNTKVQPIKKQIHKLVFIKIKYFLQFKKIKWQATGWEKIFASYISDNKRIQNIYFFMLL